MLIKLLICVSLFVGLSMRGNMIETQEKVMRHLMEVNLFAPWILTHDVIPGQFEKNYNSRLC